MNTPTPENSSAIRVPQIQINGPRCESGYTSYRLTVHLAAPHRQLGALCSNREIHGRSAGYLSRIGGAAEPTANAPAGGLNVRLHLFLRVSSNVRNLAVGTALDEEQEVTSPVLFGQGTEKTDQFRNHHLLFRRNRRPSAIRKCRSFDVFHLRLTAPQFREADVLRDRG